MPQCFEIGHLASIDFSGDIFAQLSLSAEVHALRLYQLVRLQYGIILGPTNA